MKLRTPSPNVSSSRILLVEDSDRDAYVIEAVLERSGVIIERVTSLGAALFALRSSHFDLVLTDLALPDSAGTGTVESLLEQAGITPVIVITGQQDDGLARGALQAGADEYLVKGSANASELVRAVRYALRRAEERSSDDRDEISTANAKFRALMDCAEVTLVVDAAATCIYASPSVAAVLGYKPFEMAGRPVREIIRDLHIGTTASTGRATIRHRSGRSVDVDYTITPTAPAAGRHAETVLTLRDVATERRLAGEVEQTIRLALIGRSAAAAVHELNTLIAIAAQHAEVLLAYTGGDASSAKSIALVGDALRRGRRVSEEILRFTRAPEPQLRRIDLSDWIPRVADEARALLDGQKMRVEPPATLHVQADPDQLSQVLFNLVANAVDATPASGAVTIGAARAETIPFVKERVEDASRFVVIYACDTGSGIAAETRERMFEPLFTTRTDGTGFGLATSQRVVTRHGGRILVDSAPGEGAAFYVVLPAGQEARP